MARRYLGAVALYLCLCDASADPASGGVDVDGVTRSILLRGRIAMWIGTIAYRAVVVYLLRYVWRVLLFGASYQ